MRTRPKIIFITGTDTGVGKTVFTALLLHHLRAGGCRALAIKPFCSGTRADVNLLQSLQRGDLDEGEMNPWFFREPVAPLVALAKRRRNIGLRQVLKQVGRVQARCDVLLIEGSGGLLVPLARGFTVATVIQALDCQPVVVARNRLGTINHTLLTVNALKALNRSPAAVLLMPEFAPDISSRSNPAVLLKLLRPVLVMEMPYLGRPVTARTVVRACLGPSRQALSRVARTLDI